ncbi:MAG: efflux RND transporter periplasmic adaptor subunit [Methylacidiphilales bacterium]|nr:efflux RND transporter periplasmic adaptor subunit [Candidatus Methylacidiphilales bacterium]
MPAQVQAKEPAKEPAKPQAQAQAQGGTEVPVGVVKAEMRPVAQQADFVGRVEAIDRVDVRARVKGFLWEVRFKEGDAIKAGDPLYTIEKGQFQAAVDQSQGALERAKAALTLASLQRARAEDLYAKKVGTEVARDQTVAEETSAKGAVLSAEADLANANINLGYTDITSPISGKVGRTIITKGNVVGPDSGVLTTIVSQDPMYITFPVSQRDFLRAAERGGRPDLQGIKVLIRFADGKLYDQVGQINFINVTVDRSTDTVLARASIPNPRGALIDGQFVQVELEAAKPEERVVVPQAALIADQQGLYVFIVEDGKAVVRRIKAGSEVGSDVVISEGLTGGELVVVQGLQGLRPGASVRATPVQPVGRS